MGMLINITEDKVEKMSENLEQGLRYIGKAMQCIDELKQQPGMMGERRWANQYGSGRVYHRDNYGMRDDIGSRGGDMGYRYPEYRDPLMY